MPNRKVICALDTSDLDDAVRTVRRLSPYVGAFKVGHALTLPNGLECLERLREAGATRIFLDLKFHDTPNSVARAVCQAAVYGVWMITLHIAGGPAMMVAAVEEARCCGEEARPLLVGVSVLTSLDEHTLNHDLGVPRTVEEHVVSLSKLAMDNDLDGVVSSAQEVRALRSALGGKAIIVTPGIRLPDAPHMDANQKRTGDAETVLADGANYLVLGRTLTNSDDPVRTLEKMGLPHVQGIGVWI